MQWETCCMDPGRCGALAAAARAESVTVRRKWRLWRDRKGMTLVEILIAIGILALGTMGIASLFYLGVRNASVSWHRLTAAAVARNAITSLRSYSLDLSVLPGAYGGLDMNDDSDLLDAAIDIPLRGWAQSFLSDALAHYHLTHTAMGHGYYYDTFQIPRDVLLPASLAGKWQGTTAYVSCPWDADYGWTATIWPTPIDDDADGLADEDPPGNADGVGDDNDDGDGLVDEDGPNVSGRAIFQVQVAAWRKYRLIRNVGAVSATFQPGSQTVSIAGATADFWNKVKVGDWIRHRRHGVWYRVMDLDRATDRVVLAEPFSHPFATTLTGPVDLADRFHLISVYDAAIGR